MNLSSFMREWPSWILVPQRNIIVPEYARRQEGHPADIWVGCALGDEGKWKIGDTLWGHAVRFNGGHNAGHTLMVNGVTYDFHIVPSSIVDPTKMAIIARTCVVGLELPKARKDEESGWKKFDTSKSGDIVCNHKLDDMYARMSDRSIQKVWVFPELEQVRSKHIDPNGRLFISKNATLIGVHHILLDALSEEIRERLSVPKIGSTGSGIAPAYGKTHTIIEHAITHGQWVLPEYRELAQNLKSLNEQRWYSSILFALQRPNTYMSFVEAEWAIMKKYFPNISFDEIKKEQYRQIALLRQAKEQCKIIIGDEKEKIRQLIRENGRIIGEWAQSLLIGDAHSVYGTTSNPDVTTFCEATGIREDEIGNIFLVMKLPPSSVGTRPIDFMRYPESSLLERLRQDYREFGVSTGRPRDIVQISLVETARAVELLLAWTGSPDTLRDRIVPVLNRADGLRDFAELTGGQIPIVTGYTHHVWGETHVGLYEDAIDRTRSVTTITPKNLLTNYPDRNMLGHPDMFKTSSDKVIKRMVGWDLSVNTDRMWAGVGYVTEYVLAAIFGNDVPRDVILGTWPKRGDLVVVRKMTPSR